MSEIVNNVDLIPAAVNLFKEIKESVKKHLNQYTGSDVTETELCPADYAKKLDKGIPDEQLLKDMIQCIELTSDDVSVKLSIQDTSKHIQKATMDGYDQALNETWKRSINDPRLKVQIQQMNNHRMMLKKLIPGIQSTFIYMEISGITEHRVISSKVPNMDLTGYAIDMQIRPFGLAPYPGKDKDPLTLMMRDAVDEVMKKRD